MGSLTKRVSDAATTNGSSFVSASFTPVAGDVLVVVTFGATITGATPTLTASANGITFTLVGSVLRATTEDMQLWVANQRVPASPSAMTLTYGPGGSASGYAIGVASSAGGVKAGLAAIRQWTPTPGAGVTVTSTFGVAPLTGNPVIEFLISVNNPAAITPPTGWTEQDDTGFATPTRGWEWSTKDSGFTSTTVSATGPVGSWATIIAEMDLSATGIATGNIAWAGSAAGKRDPKGSATGNVAWAGSAVGKRDPKATVSGNLAWVGTAVGRRDPKATGTGTLAWAGTGVGKRDPKAVSTGTLAWSGTAAGIRMHEGTATGVLTWEGTGTGTRAPVGGATGLLTWVGTAEGVRTPRGAGSGLLAWVGAATGQAPVVSPAQGEASGLLSWHGTATGKRFPKGAASGMLTWAGVALGVTARRGMASGLLSWGGTATGEQTTNTPPERTHLVGADPRLSVVGSESRSQVVRFEDRATQVSRNRR